MQKVITVNLNGNAFQLDETAFTALRAYLDGAEVQLTGNPDQAEIVADLEQAVADKCGRFLGPRKTVVTGPEIAAIIEEMGPVANAPGVAAGASTQANAAATDPPGTAGPAKRLYQLRDGAMITGVCNGLAAYLGIDVTIVRIVFVVLALLTRGGWVIAYLILMAVIPTAGTAEEQAAARGRPFSAQNLVDEAQRRYAAFRSDGGWRAQKAHWRWQRREWKRGWRGRRRWGWESPMPPPPVGYGTQVLAGLSLPLLSLASVALFWVWLCVLLSLLMSGDVFGLALPPDMPFWVGIIVAVVLYNLVGWPLHAARRASRYALGSHYHGGVAAWDGLMGVGFSLVFFYLAYHYVPEVRDLIHNLRPIVESLHEVKTFALRRVRMIQCGHFCWSR